MSRANTNFLPRLLEQRRPLAAAEGKMFWGEFRIDLKRKKNWKKLKGVFSEVLKVGSRRSKIFGRKGRLGLLPVHVVGAVWWWVRVRVLWCVEFVELSSELKALCSRPLSFCDSKRSMSPQLIGQRPTYVQRISPYHTRLSGHSLHFSNKPHNQIASLFRRRNFGEVLGTISTRKSKIWSLFFGAKI